MELIKQAQAAEIQRRKEWLVNYLSGVMPPDDTLLVSLIADVRQSREGAASKLD